MNEEKKTNIFETKNYNKSLDSTEEEILHKYCELVNEYLFHITENIMIQNREYYIFIILRGLHTLKHIFNTMILYTKNLDLTVYHSKKAYLFYVEFIGQIGDDNNSYLQLNSKDATLFVYKKTIFELNNEYRKQFVLSEVEKQKFKYLNIFSRVLNEIYEEVIYNDNFKGKTKMSYMMYVQKMTIKAIHKLLFLKKSVEEKIEICERYLYYKNLLKHKSIVIDECLFFNLSNLFFKKIQNGKTINIDLINKKLYSNQCDIKLKSETPLKFTNWLFNRKQ